MNWYGKRFGWQIDGEELFFSPGVVPAIAFLINCLTKEGDGVVSQRPDYYPFTETILSNERKVASNALVRKNASYEMGFEDLEQKFADGNNKGMLLCSPHNPIPAAPQPSNWDKYYLHQHEK